MQLKLLEQISLSDKNFSNTEYHSRLEVEESIANSILQILNSFLGSSKIGGSYAIDKPYVEINDDSISNMEGQIKKYETRLFDVEITLEEDYRYHTIVMSIMSFWEDQEFAFNVEYIVEYHLGMVFFSKN